MKKNIPQQLYNLSEDTFRVFTYITFSEVSKPYVIISTDLKIKKEACIGGNLSMYFELCHFSSEDIYIYIHIYIYICTL